MSSGPAGLVQLVPPCQVSPVNPTPRFLSSLTPRGGCSQPGAPCACSCALDLLVVVTLPWKSHSELQLVATLLWEGCLCCGGCGSLGKPKSIPNVLHSVTGASQLRGLAVLTATAPGGCARAAVAQQGAVAALCNNRSQFAHAQR